MIYFIVFIAVLCFTALWLYSKNERELHPEDADAGYSTSEWITAGGILGVAILVARFARVPLASIITSLPFILPYLKRAEATQAQAGSAYMSKREAALILGVSENASEEQVREAHRNLITRNHPDKGGSEYLAAKINQARDILLK